MEGIKEDTKSFSPYPLLVIGLILLAYALIQQIWLMAAAVVIVPFLTFYIVTVLNKPYWGFITPIYIELFFHRDITLCEYPKQQCDDGCFYYISIGMYFPLFFMRRENTLAKSQQ